MAAFVPLQAGERVSHADGKLGGGKIWTIDHEKGAAFCEFSPGGFYHTGFYQIGELCRLGPVPSCQREEAL